MKMDNKKRPNKSLSRLTDDMSEDEVWESDCENLDDYVQSGPKRKDPRVPPNPKISMKDERGSIVDAGSVIVREFLAYCGLKKSIDGTRSKLEEGEHPFEPVVSDHEIDFKDNLHTGYEPYIPKKEFIRDHYLRASLRSQIRELSLRDRRSPIVDGSKDMDIAAGVASRLIPLVLDCFHLYAQVRGLTEEEERSLILSDMVVRSGDPTKIELILFGKITGRWEAQRYRLFHNFIENIARLWNWLMKDESDPGFEYPEEERIRKLYKEGKLTLTDLLDKQDPVTRWPSKDDPNEFGGKFNYVPRFTDLLIVWETWTRS